MADIVLIFAMAVFAVTGYKKGFVRSVLGIITLAASVILAWILYPVVADILASAGFDNILTEKIQDSIGGYLSSGSELPSGIKDLLAVNESAFAAGINGAAAIVARLAINIISFVIVLIAARILLGLVIRLFKVMKSLPVLGAFDGIAGLLAGVAQGIIIIYIALAAVCVTVPFGKCGEIHRTIEDSKITKTMYEHNPIMDCLYNIGELGEVKYE